MTHTTPHTATALIATAALLFAAGGASANTVLSLETGDGDGADSYVNAGASANTNFGANAQINIKDPGSVNDFTRKGYVRFDLSELRLGGAVVTDASVDYVVSLNNGGGGAPTTPQNFTVYMFGLNDGNAGEGWVEGNGGTDNSPVGEVTWTNAPANDTATDDGVTGDAASIGSLAVSNTDVVGTTVSFSSAGLIDFLNADTDERVTMILTRDSSNSSHNLNFATKESGTYDAPTLNITTDSVFINARADTYVNDDDATDPSRDQNNYGSSTQLVVKDAGDSRFTRKAYLGFDITGTKPSDVRDVEVLLDVAAHDMGGGASLDNMNLELWGLVDGNAGEQWVEGTGQTGVTGATPPNPIVFDNAPGNAAEGNGFTGDAVHLASMVLDPSVAVGETISFTNADSISTDALLNFVKADTDGFVTFIVRRVGDNSQNNLAFASKEHATLDGPTLRLAVPAPSALPAGLVLLATFGARRRRS